MELYLINHHLISYSEMVWVIGHLTWNSAQPPLTLNFRRFLVPWKSHIPLLFFKLAYREVSIVFVSGPGQAYLCSWKVCSQSLDYTFCGGYVGVRGRKDGLRDG